MSKLHAAYSRYSSTNQHEESIIDQEREIKKFYAGKRIPENKITFFKDEALSGENVTRPGYDELMARIAAGEVATLVVDDQGRLTREMDIDTLLKFFRFHGTQFFSIKDNVDSKNKRTLINAKVKGFLNNLSNTERADQVRRGLEGCALNVDGCAGDHPYGYKSEWVDPDEGANYLRSGGSGRKPRRKVVIFEEEANVVRQVFEWFVVLLLSLNKIARRLNAIKAQKGSRSKGTTEWSPGRVGELLRNRKYCGHWVWGANYTTKLGDQRRDHEADPMDVARVDRPHLAIVSPEMFAGAQKRFEGFKDVLGPLTGKSKRTKRGLYAREYPFNLLSGMLYCAGCGTRLHRASGNGGNFYRCPIRARDGNCKSKSSANKVAAEKAIIGFVQDKLDKVDEWFEMVRVHVVTNIEAHDAHIPSEKENKLRRKAELDRVIETLSANLSGMVSPSLAAKLVAAEKELAEVNKGLEAMERDQGHKRELPTMADVAAELSNLVSLMNEKPTHGCLLLRKIIGKIVVEDVIFPGWERGYAKMSFRFDPMRLLSAVFEQDGLFNAAGESPMAEDIVLFTGAPTKTQLLMPQIHEWRQEKPPVPWLEIHRRTKLSAHCAGVYYKRWCAAMGYTPS